MISRGINGWLKRMKREGKAGWNTLQWRNEEKIWVIHNQYGIYVWWRSNKRKKRKKKRKKKGKYQTFVFFLPKISQQAKKVSTQKNFKKMHFLFSVSKRIFWIASVWHIDAQPILKVWIDSSRRKALQVGIEIILFKILHRGKSQIQLNFHNELENIQINQLSWEKTKIKFVLMQKQKPIDSTSNTSNSSIPTLN